MQYVFQKIKFCFQVCHFIDSVGMKHTVYNFLKRTKVISSCFSIIQIIYIIKSETPTLPPHLPISYICQISCTIQLHLHHLPSLLAKFSGSHFESITVNSPRLRIDTCYFYLGKLIHFKMKMPLPIGDLSWYFSKWQLAYFEYFCDREWSRIYFQISLFSCFNYFKMARASRALPPSPESYQEL